MKSEKKILIRLKKPVRSDLDLKLKDEKSFPGLTVKNKVITIFLLLSNERFLCYIVQ